MAGEKERVPRKTAWANTPYQELWPQVLKYVHRLTGDADFAEDVAQDAFLRLAAASRDREPGNPRAWLFRTATNLVRDHARREHTFRRLPIEAGADPPIPDVEVERQQAIRSVRKVLQMLPQRDREILILRESGFRSREIAEILNLRTDSVPTFAMRALRRFRTEYLKEFDDGTHL